MFFIFSKFWIFWVVKGVKRQKNGLKSCLSCSISQEPYIIWLSFMVHMCKMTISAGCFFIFSFWFLGCYWGKRAKDSSKWQKIMWRSISQERYIIWLSFMVHKYKMTISVGVFFFYFFKILIFWVVYGVIFLGCSWGKRAKSGLKWRKQIMLCSIAQ